MYFEYGEKETDYLKAKDPKMAEVIERIGHIDRPADPDLFTSVVTSIIGQQISTKAQQTICRRMTERYGTVTPELIAGTTDEELQSLGLTFRKVAYIKDFADKICSGEFELDAVAHKDIDAVAAREDGLIGLRVFQDEVFAVGSVDGIGGKAEGVAVVELARADHLAGSVRGQPLGGHDGRQVVRQMHQVGLIHSCTIIIYMQLLHLLEALVHIVKHQFVTIQQQVAHLHGIGP